jgi:hypothetical protein
VRQLEPSRIAQLRLAAPAIFDSDEVERAILEKHAVELTPLPREQAILLANEIELLAPELDITTRES